MKTFKTGNKVVLVNPDRYESRNAKAMKKLANNTLVVHSVSSDGSVVFAGLPGKRTWPWHSKDLALAYEDWEEPSSDYSHYTRAFRYPEDFQLESDQDKANNPEPVTEVPEPNLLQIEASHKPKSLRRGDLVIYDGDICVVLSKFDGDDGGDYVVASMTRDPYYCWPKVSELTPVGSIRKKIKKIKNLTGVGK